MFQKQFICITYIYNSMYEVHNTKFNEVNIGQIKKEAPNKFQQINIKLLDKVGKVRPCIMTTMSSSDDTV